MNPLHFQEDFALDYWHIIHDGKALCDAALADIKWCLPDYRSIEVELCLDCWERLAVEYVQLKTGSRAP